MHACISLSHTRSLTLSHPLSLSLSPSLPSHSDGHTSSTVGDRLVAQLLVEMAGLESRGDIVVIAATNRPDMIDKVREEYTMVYNRQCPASYLLVTILLIVS